MPTFDSGNSGWDQGLASLGNALFPDPSKVAQSYYYGALSRKAQIEGYGDINKMNYGIVLRSLIKNGGVPPAPLTYSQPDIPGMGPVVNAPATTPMGPSRISSTVAPDPGAPAGRSPTGQAYIPLTMTPAQAAQTIADRVENNPQLMQGTPPPMSPPSPVSPAAPTTTTTAGTVPNNDPASGALHPGSVTPSDGGRKTTGPAQSNGSPAEPVFNLPAIELTAMQAGMPSDQAHALALSTLFQAHQQGRISDDMLYKGYASAGQPSPLTTTISDRGATTRQAMSDKAAMDRQQAVIGGENYRAGLVPEFVPNPADPLGAGSFRTRADIAKSAGGMPAGPPTAAAPAATSLYATGTYFGKDGQPTTMTHAEAIKTNAQPVPGTMEQATAQAMAAIRRETNPEKRAQMIEDLLRSSPAKDVSPQEFAQLQSGNYNTDQTFYATAQPGYVKQGIDYPIAFSDAAQRAIRDREQLLYNKNQMYRSDASLRHFDAVSQLVQEKVLESPADIDKKRPAMGNKGLFAGDPRVIMQVNPYDRKAGAVGHMKVDLKQNAQAEGSPAQTTPTSTTAPAGPAPAPSSYRPRMGGAPPADQTPAAAQAPAPVPAPPGVSVPTPPVATPVATPEPAPPVSRVFRPSMGAPGSSPAEPFTAAPASAPAAAGTVQPAASQPVPRGALGWAKPGARPGDVVRLQDGRIGVIKSDGAIYPVQ